MSILVTGASGYVGGMLVRHLVQTRQDVTVLARAQSRFSILESLKIPLRVCRIDGTRESLRAAVKEAQPHVVVHLASLYLSEHRPQDVEALLESNVVFPTQLLEELEAVGCRHFINVGSAWQHYQDAAYNPVNLYAATKQAFADLLEYYVQARGFSALSLKLFDTYGPFDFRPKLFSLLRQSAQSHDVLSMSQGEQLLDLVYIDDVVEALMLALQRVTHLTQAESYGVCTQKPLSLKEVVALYSEVVGRPIQIHFGAKPYRAREVMTPWTRASWLPGWKPQVSLREGITRMEKDANIGGLLSK